MSANIDISSDHIVLRSTTEYDIDAVMAMERDSENVPFIRQWSRQQHRASIRDDNMAHLTIRRVTETGIVGYAILIGLKNPDQSIEFKRIVISQKGAGLGSEAVRLVKKLAFEILGAHRLWLEVMEHNQRARQLYKQEGFIEEGLHRESLKQGDRYLSLFVMSMLAHEYVADPGNGMS